MLKQAFFKTIFFLFPFYLFSVAVLSQQKYWMEFDFGEIDSQNTQISQLQESLKKMHGDKIKFHYQSKWHPVVSISIEEDLIEKLESHQQVRSIWLQNQLQQLSLHSPTPIEYSYALEQMKAQYLTDSMGLSGNNIKIGVIDGGFMDANVEPSLKHLVEKDQIKFFQDYLLKGNKDPFYGKRISQDDHGTQVLRMIVGSDHGTSIKYGMAENAELYLARTDHGIRERRLEEDYWVAALELFYDMGIRLVNSSLGYTDSYDKRKENHSKKEVNGRSSMITKTAQVAAEKGMLIVSAAGNDGHNKWEILSLPSDAKDVLTVGAVRYDDWSKIYYSSIGPEKLNYVKPDVACFAANGTSFSAPVITGLAACIWEYDTTLTNLEVINIIQKSSHLAENPNNFIGYGVPDSKKILSLLYQEKQKSIAKSTTATQDYIEIEIPANTESLVLYHKKDHVNVIEQQSIKIKDGQTLVRIKKPEKAKYTSIVAQDQFNLEVEWK
ncbi:S8 family serine peptidase [Marivirga harenae]|uniref:S8 family serine peptidase n=1 Tax=Marivirga harenae TaxID=2010992 RepID=UPI0026DFBF98|nr:S8 family serine peptidase [Marivirga harenae]WKV10982.1 S8 family serine peptidase [Marivirga harenae]|tara:strand:- start:44768 stop:46252 length:1485 start_codon:yes stop_codon:yes gene_type:complete